MKTGASIYWLASYPKSGNTWMRIFIANLLAGNPNGIDINAINNGAIASDRFWIDSVLGFDSADLLPAEIDQMRPEIYRWSVSGTEQKISYNKIHDACTRLKNEPIISREATLGALYILRNPLDVCISASSHWGCSIDEAIERMADKQHTIALSDEGLKLQVHQRLLSWSEHVLSWVDATEFPVLVLRYEDMLNNPVQSFSAASDFLRLNASEDKIKLAVENSRFEKLSEQEKKRGFKERSKHAERFFRSGKAGGWRQQLNSRQVDKIISDHEQVMLRFNYLDNNGDPR